MIRSSWVLVGMGSLVLGFSVASANAQRGVGDSAGVAQQATRPEITEVSGTIAEVRSAPCESTTGKAIQGTHVLLATEDGRTLNVHLGPTSAVNFAAKQLELGKEVVARIFRTDKLPAENYVAQSFTVEGHEVALRDEILRPVWAGGRRASDGSLPQGNGRGGRRMMGLGCGVGYGPCRFGASPAAAVDSRDSGGTESNKVTEEQAESEIENVWRGRGGRGPCWGGSPGSRGNGNGAGCRGERGRGFGAGYGGGW